MKVIRPASITAANLTSSTVAETDTYNAGTTYTAGQQVSRTTTHKVYESIAGGNVGHTPETSPAQWLVVGPTNRWKMFDQSVGSATTATGTMTYVLTPGGIDSLGLVDLDAASATVTMTVSGTPVYSRTLITAVGGAIIDDWYRYFFEPVGTRSVLVFEGMPVYPTCVVTVTINGVGSSMISCGTLLAGRMLDLGSTEAGPGVGINDFSRKETDDFGVTSVVERAWSKRMNLRTLTSTSFVDTIQRELAQLRARPSLWIGEDGYDSLVVYGFFKSFDLDLNDANNSYCSLAIEGLSTAT